MVRTRPDRTLSSPTLVGRGRELELLVAALGKPPALVVVEGEAGAGKTRLITEAATELKARPRTVAGLRFVVGASRRIREPFPLGPVIEAVRGLGDELAGARLSPLAGALRPLLPELAAHLPPAPEPLDDRAAERHRVFRALVELLGSVGPVVLVLEDLHWADEQTLDFVDYLLADPPGQLSVVLTFRGEEASPQVRALTARIPAATRRVHLVLAPMDPPRAGALAAAILGLDRVSEEFAGYLCERASGLPLAIEELLALLQANGKLVRRNGDWARRDLAELDVPTGIRDQVLERVARLSEPARAVVEAAAVLQTSVPVPVVASTCRTPAEQVLPGLAEALACGLLVEHGELVGFRHVLAAQAVEEAVPGPRRQQLHARAAAALGTLDPVPLGQLAHHHRHARQLPEWVRAAEQAADAAVALRHDAEAVRLLEDVVRHGPLPPAERVRLAVKLGWAALETVHTREVADLLGQVLDRGGAPALQGELRVLAATMLHVAGEDLPRQLALLATAVDELVDRPELRARAMVALGVQTASTGRLTQGRAWLHRSLALLAEVPDPAVRVFVLGKAGMGLVTQGDPGWRPVLDRIETAADHALVRIALAQGDAEAALAATERCLTVLTGRGAWAAIVPVLPTATEALLAAGRPAEAGALLANCTRELKGLDVPTAPAALRHARGLREAAGGDAPRAARHLLAAALRYDALPHPYQAAQAREQAAQALLGAGDRPAGAGELSSALGAYRRLGASWDYARAIGAARHGGLAVPDRRRTGRPRYGNTLSPREREVAELAAAGRPNKEIAAELFLSVYTVEQHVTAVLRKLAIRSRVGIAGRLPAPGPASQDPARTLAQLP